MVFSIPGGCLAPALFACLLGLAANNSAIPQLRLMHDTSDLLYFDRTVSGRSPARQPPELASLFIIYADRNITRQGVPTVNSA